MVMTLTVVCHAVRGHHARLPAGRAVRGCRVRRGRFRPRWVRTRSAPAFSGAVEQFVEVLAAQRSMFSTSAGLLFGFGHWRSPECETRLVGGFLVGTKMGNQMAMPALQPVDL